MDDFKVMSEMSKSRKDIRMFPLKDNFKGAKTGKNGFGELTIAVNNSTIFEIFSGKKFVGGLYLMDEKQFFDIKQPLNN